MLTVMALRRVGAASRIQSLVAACACPSSSSLRAPMPTAVPLPVPGYWSSSFSSSSAAPTPHKPTPVVIKKKKKPKNKKKAKKHLVSVNGSSSGEVAPAKHKAPLTVQEEEELLLQRAAASVVPSSSVRAVSANPPARSSLPPPEQQLKSSSSSASSTPVALSSSSSALASPRARREVAREEKPHEQPQVKQQQKQPPLQPQQQQVQQQKAKQQQQLKAATTASTTNTTRPSSSDSSSSSPPPSSPQDKQNNSVAASAEKIFDTLREIKTLQSTLPNAQQIARMVRLLQQQQSFHQGFALFDLYRNYGNAFLDEKFLIPGVRACCEAKEPKRALQVVNDMLMQGRKIDRTTLRALAKACDETDAAEEVIQVWRIMEHEKIPVSVQDLHTFLSICRRANHIDGALQVLKELRVVEKQIPVDTYMYWLTQATRWWRADAFFDLLMEMRLSGVEPEIPSLTSLESGRTDLALTVMEGVRAVGLDPCFAMASVCSSIEAVVHNKMAPVITRKDINRALKQFDGRKPLELTWDSQPIPQVLETQAAGLLLRQENFRRLNKKQVTRIERMLELLPIDSSITLNLKNQLLRQSLIVNTARIESLKHKIAKEYASGAPLIKLSEQYSYPPVGLFRKILRAQGMSQKQIKEAIQVPASRLNERDEQELRKATYYDSTHRSDAYLNSPQYNPKSLEKALEHFFRSKGLRIKTEADLAEEQKQTHGRAVLSPDILLLDPLIINGVPIRWIDAKNYYGSHIVMKRNQTHRLLAYTKEWGPGAVVFGMGHSDMLAFPGAICLDTSALPKTTFERAKMRVKSFLYSCVGVLRFRAPLPSQLTQVYPTAFVEDTKDSN